MELVYGQRGVPAPLVRAHQGRDRQVPAGPALLRRRRALRRDRPAASSRICTTRARRSTALNRAVYNQKDTDPEVYTIGVLDIERGQRDDIAEHPWQTDTSVGDWFYNVRDVYKTPRHVLEMLVDIVSKNGNLLLNIPQRPDGTLDDECDYLLRRMAAWMKPTARGSSAAGPGRSRAKGRHRRRGGAFNEEAVGWSAEDFRFTRKGETLYAYQMRRPENSQALIRSLATGKRAACDRRPLAGTRRVRRSSRPPKDCVSRSRSSRHSAGRTASRSRRNNPLGKHEPDTIDETATR